MLIVTVCVGSSCCVRGSDELATKLQQCIEREHLEGRVDIVGAFCMDGCSQGISVRVGDRQFSGIRPEDGESFFYREIIGNLDRDSLVRAPNREIVL
ncbi:MAG: (2Fe-2S) ferredoxin domain-containing protein [Deltaproteobacteria bacterium]|nr:(2Fe-2S) ferredoxin domain-containing protein [Deltaproteobacteria bacterium]